MDTLVGNDMQPTFLFQICGERRGKTEKQERSNQKVFRIANICCKEENFSVYDAFS
jgi:hypothetical protein